jgi:predicted PhzF superfamily epimerase YddE/YHI9
MTTRLTVVDAFTDRPFAGNPAAVCLLDAPAPAGWMQSVASEMNLSETAFCVVRPDSPGEYDLRWFTPVAEVDLCGHATLATTHVLGGDARFATRSGELRGSVGGDGWIALDFPADAPKPVEPPDGLDAVLGGTTPVAVAAGRDDWLVELADEDVVRTLRPDLAALVGIGRRGLIATAAGWGVDVVSRCFFPAYGIPEDPVTGSAHCTIALHWAERLGDMLVCEQASARGGIVRTRLAGDRVELRGQALSVSEVTLHSDPG